MRKNKNALIFSQKKGCFIMKRKLLCGICIALILALSLCILAAATRMNQGSPSDTIFPSPRDILPDGAGNAPTTDGGAGNGNDSGILDGLTNPNGNMGNGTTGNAGNGMTDNAGNGMTDGMNGNTGNGMTDNTQNGMNGNENGAGNDNAADSAPQDTDMLPMDTNIPDADIGGAVGDNDGDSIPDAVDSDDDNDGVTDPADSDADGDGVNDDEKTTGIVGIILAVIIVVAVIIVIIAVVPKKPKES